MSFDSGTIYQQFLKSYEMRSKQVENMWDETNVAFTLSFSSGFSIYIIASEEKIEVGFPKENQSISENFYNFSMRDHVNQEIPNMALSVTISYLNTFWVLKSNIVLMASVSTCLS